MKIQVEIMPGEDGHYVARCPSLKSCWSQGRTREEALANIQEAIELYLEPSPSEMNQDGMREVVELSL
ncbi:MAG: type II toxin-antitoxin system HicB family antitoxin [Candidatus Hydrogenedentes bacterium]|nr:type II toxin-antitoxin system HicB family antitoxin [Candidatus Hydrogenedentota bacterium]